MNPTTIAERWTDRYRTVVRAYYNAMHRGHVSPTAVDAIATQVATIGEFLLDLGVSDEVLKRIEQDADAVAETEAAV